MFQNKGIPVTVFLKEWDHRKDYGSQRDWLLSEGGRGAKKKNGRETSRENSRVSTKFKDVRFSE